MVGGEEPSSSPPDSYDRCWSEVYGDLQRLGPTHRHMRRILRRMLRGLDYESVVDVGCGAGHNLPLLTEGRRLGRVCGLDVSPAALDRAREVGDGDFVLADVQAESLDERFDLVFSSLVLEHLPDDVAALRNMRAMARHHLVVTTIAGDFERYRPWEEQMGHERNYRRGELEEKVRSAGFAVERALYWGFPFYSPLARRLQNRMRSEPNYGPASRAAAQLMYWLYFLNSSRRGDVLLLHARVSAG